MNWVKIGENCETTSSHKRWADPSWDGWRVLGVQGSGREMRQILDHYLVGVPRMCVLLFVIWPWLTAWHGPVCVDPAPAVCVGAGASKWTPETFHFSQDKVVCFALWKYIYTIKVLSLPPAAASSSDGFTAVYFCNVLMVPEWLL